MKIVKKRNPIEYMIYTAIIGVILLGVFLLLKDKSDKKVKYEKKLVTLR